jgi:hypothetical protein
MPCDASASAAGSRQQEAKQMFKRRIYGVLAIAQRHPSLFARLRRVAC